MSVLLLALSIIYVVFCMCYKKDAKLPHIIWSIVFLVLMGVNWQYSTELNQEMEMYKEYYRDTKVIIEGMAEITGLNDLPEHIPADSSPGAASSAATIETKPQQSQDHVLSDVPGTLIYSTSGAGDSIVQSISVESPSYCVFTTNDDRHHAVKAWYGDGDFDYELLVNSSSPYSGRTYLTEFGTYDFEITCTSEWKLEIFTIGTTVETSFSGKGDYVTDIFQPDTKYYNITYTGSDHFAVKQRYGTDEYDYELLVNETEPYSGTVRLSNIDSPCFFEITGEEGTWIITPAE